MMDVVEVGAPWQYAGGATSFTELDRWHAQQDRIDAVAHVNFQFDMLLDNIRQQEVSAAEKAAKMATLVAEYSERTTDAAANPEEAFKALRAAVQAIARPELPSATGMAGTFTASKDRTGQTRWITVHANKYRDRDQEIFKDAAHKDYEAYVDASGDYPDLRLWHVPYPVGKADVVAYDADHGFMVASGTFLPGFEDVADRLVEAGKSASLGCSHGFKYHMLDRLDREFDWYRDFEISILPLDAAANPLTDGGLVFTGREADDMTISTKQRTFLVDMLGEERMADVESRIATLAKQASEEGIDFKAVAESFKDETPPVAEAVAEESAPPAGEEAPSGEPAAEGDGDGGEPGVTGEAGDGGGDAAPAAAEPGALDTPVDGQPTQPLDTPGVAAAAPLPTDEGSKEAQFVNLLEAAIGRAMTPLVERMDVLEAGHKALAEHAERSFLDSIASAIRPRVGVTDAKAASESPANVIPRELVDAVKARVDPEPEESGSPAWLAPYMQGLHSAPVVNGAGA